MSQFVLEDHEASIDNLNLRIQRHGEDRVLAADIKFQITTSNDILDQFGPDLKKDLFRKPGKGEQQTLEGIGAGLTAVKHPELTLKGLAHEFSGYELEVGGLLGESEPIVLVDSKVKRFTIDPKEGGSVVLGFTVSAEVESEDVADLSDAFIRGTVRVSLSPGKASGEAEPTVE